MKNLLVISSAFPEYYGDYKGIFVVDYIKALENLYNIEVYSPILKGKEKGFSDKIYQEINVKKYVYTNKNLDFATKILSYIIFFYIAIRKTNKLNKPDIIHVHGSIFIGGIIGLFVSRKYNCPIVYTEHMGRIDHEYKGLISSCLYRKISAKFDKISTVSDYIKQKLIKKGIDDNKIVVISNPVNTELFIPSENKSKQVLFVGRFDENKGILRVIMAFSKICKELNDFILVIVGNGNQKNQVDWILQNDFELKKRIKIYDILPKKDIVKLMQNSYCLVAPSVIESFCLSVAEAMSCGIPVIVGKGNATNEYVDTESGVIVDPNSIDDIAEAISYIVKNISIYNQTIIRNKIVSSFSFEIIRNDLSNTYNELITVNS